MKARLLFATLATALCLLCAPHAQAGGSFHGVVSRTDPNAIIDGSVTTKVVLLKGDEIVMNDGTVVDNWPPGLTADLTVPGAGGQDSCTATPCAVASTSWYDEYAIRSSTTGAQSLLLHLHKSYALDQAQVSGVSTSPLLINSSQQRLAQSFKLATSGKIEIVDVPVQLVGAISSSHIWFTIEADNSGVPSGVPLATSDKIAVNFLNTSVPPDFNLRAIFRTGPPTVTAGTTYWLVLYGDYPVSASNYIEWYTGSGDTYTAGVPATFNGSAWAYGTNDFTFKIYVTHNDDPVAMPTGYDQYALICYFYTSGTSFDPSGCNDRHFTWMIRSTGGGGSDLEGFTCSVPCIRDANIVFPHGLPVIANIAVQGSSAGTVLVGGLPEGYERKPGDWDNAVTGYIQSPKQYVYVGPVASEYGGLYVSSGAGSSTVMIPSWDW